jgi:hypothetical protein
MKNTAYSSVSERKRASVHTTISSFPEAMVFSFLERKKEDQIAKQSVKEENEVILDRPSVAIGIMEFLQKETIPSRLFVPQQSVQSRFGIKI